MFALFLPWLNSPSIAIVKVHYHQSKFAILLIKNHYFHFYFNDSHLIQLKGGGKKKKKGDDFAADQEDPREPEMAVSFES